VLGGSTILNAESRPNYYELLGVSSNASGSEIKHAYRLLAQRIHPDRNPADPRAEEQFKSVAEAYRVLSDPVLRSRYDDGVGQESTRARYERPATREDSFWSNLRQAAGPWPKKGSDLRFTLELDLIDVVRGGSFRIDVTRQRVCPQCNQASDSCPLCKGIGFVVKVDGILIKVPAGLKTGSRVMLEREGDAGVHGGQPGDLYVDIRIKPHAFLRAEGTRLSCEVPIPFPLAGTGGKVQLPYLAGLREISLPPGVQDGHQVRFPKEGLPDSDTGVRGDFVVTFRVETPVNLDTHSMKLLHQFSRSSGVDSYPLVREYRRRLNEL
jgi:molecular chaperone DnaJ